MNRFESRWFIAIMEKFISLIEKRLVTFILMQQSKFPSITKKQPKNNMVLQDALSAVDATKKLCKIILSKNFNRFYDKTVTTSEEHFQYCLSPKRAD